MKLTRNSCRKQVTVTILGVALAIGLVLGSLVVAVGSLTHEDTHNVTATVVESSARNGGGLFAIVEYTDAGVAHREGLYGSHVAGQAINDVPVSNTTGQIALGGESESTWGAFIATVLGSLLLGAIVLALTIDQFSAKLYEQKLSRTPVQPARNVVLH